MPRLRDLGIQIGTLTTGRYNAITDVPGVLVGYETVMSDAPFVARTGVTVILPRGEQSWQEPVFGGYHSFNGCGEVTGVAWLKESGLLYNPIAITGTPGWAQCGTRCRGMRLPQGTTTVFYCRS